MVLDRKSKCDRYLSLGKNAASLGRGAYGQVRPAWDQDAERLVAIKEQRRESDTAKREMMFFQVVPQHPNLLRLLDMFASGPLLSLVFEYCVYSLADMFQRSQGFLDWHVVWRYSLEVLQGVAHLHRNGVSHRDLGMSNVLIREDGGTCVVADLGLAVSASNCILERPVTTAWYRAPEACFAGNSLVCQQSALDLWSYGALLAALWTGTHVFKFPLQADLESENHVLIQHIVNVMGAPEKDWPDIVEFPEWSAMRQTLQIPAQPKPFQDRLQCTCNVQRPLRGWPEVVDLIASLVVWSPKMRAPVERCLQHELWGEKAKRKVDGAFDVGIASLSPVVGLIPQSSEPEQSYPSTSELEKTPQSGLHCACSGNCGNRPCIAERRRRNTRKSKGDSPERKKQKTWISSWICSNYVDEGSGPLCRDCMCSMIECRRPRSSNTRFCMAHIAHFQSIGKNSYLNQYGEHKFDKAWTSELALVAKHGWMLSQMCPMDAVAFFAAANKLVGSRTTLFGFDLLHLFIIGFLKLPHAVEAWIPWMHEPDTQLRSAADFATASCRLAEALSGNAAQWEHEQISTGSQNVILGPHTFFTKLHMLVGKGAVIDEDKNAVSVRIGKLRNLYHVVRNVDVWEALVKVADAFNHHRPDGLALPQTTAETHEFVETVKQFLEGFPTVFAFGKKNPLSKAQRVKEPRSEDTSADGSGGKYVMKHILRKIVLWALGRTPSSIWSSWTIKDIGAMSPDKFKLLAPLSPEMDRETATKLFGVDAFMLSCWACLFHGVAGKNRDAFEGELGASTKLQQVMLDLKSKHHGQEPSLNTVGQEFLKRG